MSKIKNWKSFNENMNDNLLEVLITLEEIQKNLRRSRNPISIESNDDKITFVINKKVKVAGDILINIFQ